MEVVINDVLKISISDFKEFDSWAAKNGYKYFPCSDEWWNEWGPFAKSGEEMFIHKKSSMELYAYYLKNKKTNL